MVNTQNYKKKSKSNIWVIYSILFSIILTPAIKIKTLPAFRIEQVIVIIFTIYMYMKLILRKKTNKIDLKFPLTYIGFSFFIILSILVGSFKGIKVIPNDFFEIYKIFIYLGIYLVTVMTVKNEEDKVKVLNFMIFCLLISVAISVQQYFNLFNLNERYVPTIAPTQFRTLVKNYPYPRVVGMTSNPNVYSIMPGIGAIISWAMFSITRDKKYVLYIMIFVFGSLITLSRSGFFFMISGMVTFTFLYSFKSNINRLMKGFINLKTLRTVIISIVILVLLVIIIFRYLPEKLTWRLKAGIDIGSDNSFQARLRNWNEHISYFKSSPIFGIGPAKSIEYEKCVDNEWLLFLRQYGIVGCIYIVFTFLFPFTNSKDITFKCIYISMLVGSALYMIPAAIYHSFQLMPLVLIIAGLISNDTKIQKNDNLF